MKNAASLSEMNPVVLCTVYLYDGRHSLISLPADNTPLRAQYIISE